MVIEPILAEPGTITFIVISLIAAAALSLAGMALAGKGRQQGTTANSAPQLSSRGSYLPLLLGRHVVGPLIGWAGNESSSGGGGGRKSSSGQTKTYWASAWHMLVIGPAYALYTIREAEKIIYKTPITRDDTPSGSVIECEDGSSFEIWWGDCDQEVSARLAAAVGVQSGWPNVAYIFWVKKKLGGTNSWPILEYDVEVRPLADPPPVSGSVPYYDESHPAVTSDEACVWFNMGDSIPAGTYTLEYLRGALQYDPDHDWQLNAPEYGGDRGWWIVDASYNKVLKCPGDTIRHPSQYDVEVANASASTTIVWPGGRMGLFLEDGYSVGPDNYDDNIDGSPNPTYRISGSGNSWEVSGVVRRGSYQSGTGDTGYNPGHLLWQLLTCEYPGGLGISPSLLHMPAFEATASGFNGVGDNDKMPVSILVESGESVEEQLKSLLVEAGIFLVQPSEKLMPVLLRKPQSGSVTVPASLNLEPMDEEDQQHGSFLPDRPTFVFRDRSLNYRSNAVSTRYDSQGRANRRPQVEEVTLNTVQDFKTARLVANRRSREFATRVLKRKVELTRQFRSPGFYPGRTFYLEGDPVRYRLMSKQNDGKSPRTVCEAIQDVMGADLNKYIPEGGGPTGLQAGLPPVRDRAFKPFLLPLELRVAGQLAFAVLRIRAHSQIDGAKIHISADNVHYYEVGDQSSYHFGGTINRPMDATEGMLMDEVPVGPTFTPKGRDTTQVIDLTANDGAFEAGQQMFILNNEVMLLKRVAAVSGGYQIEQFRRAVYGSTAGTHANNDMGYVLLRSEMEPFTSGLLVSGTTVYVKSVPYTIGGLSVDINDVTAVALVIP